MTSLQFFKKQTFSRISKALLHNGSASLYFPRLPYKTAKLFNVAATFTEKYFIGLALQLNMY